MKRVIAVDFDGTLCCSEYPYARDQNWLNKLILNYIKRRQRKGDIIALWTCRTDNMDVVNPINDAVSEAVNEGISEGVNDSPYIFPHTLSKALSFLRLKGFIPDLINDNCDERTKMFGANSRKVSADLYIDDKNLGAIGWFMRKVDKWSKRRAYEV